jgi:hypothetical protein
MMFLLHRTHTTSPPGRRSGLIKHLVNLLNQPNTLSWLNKFDHIEDNGVAVAQLVEARRYKAEGRKFDSRWCQWNFSLT